jgi:neopullulanase
LLVCFNTYAQYAKVYPLNWWTGMKYNKVQLLLRGDSANFSKEKIIIKYPGISITGSHVFENGKYQAIDVTIAPSAKAGIVKIECVANGKTNSISWELKEKRKGNGTGFAQGVTSSDLIYLTITDRFSDGDTTNDRIVGMRDQSLNRNEIFLRHGGDFQGIINHVDYMKDLGVTALWLLPVMENDMPDRTEHGYAITNHYKIDPRFGGEEKYKELSDKLHHNGIKLIMDIVYNHAGLYNFLVQDMPSKDWLHQWPTYTNTTYKDQTVFDPYASLAERKIMVDGWFTQQMPDLNQSNPFMANYLIQNALWYVQEFGIDGIRIDTYPYNDPDFSNRCNQALMDEFPKLSIFGECMVHGTANQAYFAQNNINTTFKSNLQGVVDFQLLWDGITPALTQNFGWTEGVNKLYQTLSNDFLYKNPMNNVLLLDNHDQSRFFSIVGENVNKQKMGYLWLLTCRGIPQMYYGSEFLMKGFTNPDGWVRLDFPGGWKDDKKNAFTGEGLTADELSTQQMVRTMANFRKNSSAIKTGKLMQYLPVDAFYVYFRYDENQTVMCIMNTSESAKEVDFSKYTERTNGFAKAKNILGNEIYNISTDKPSIPAMQMWVLELEK